MGSVALEFVRRRDGMAWGGALRQVDLAVKAMSEPYGRNPGISELPGSTVVDISSGGRVDRQADSR
jgi:hypothetical protein